MHSFFKKTGASFLFYKKIVNFAKYDVDKGVSATYMRKYHETQRLI